MTSQCLTEQHLLALLAGDSYLDEWQEHLAGCPACRALWQEQEPLQKALGQPLNDAVLDRLVRAGRVRLKKTLELAARPRAYYGAWPDSPVGQIFVAVSERGLCGVSFRNTEEDFVQRLKRRGFDAVGVPEHVIGAISQLREYFDGRRRRFDMTIDLTGQTPFQRLVLERTADVPAGQVVSYGDVARRIGKPRAMRAVGAALGQNPIPIVVPCHRVIGSDGGLHGYSGGLDIKERLLKLEGAQI
jgi:methylated-DNA-[protein]-cysteine S-methyltransferase